MLERMAGQKDMLLLPAPEKDSGLGKAVYRLGGSMEGKGGVLLYVDDGVVFVYSLKAGEGSKWTPVGVDELFEMAAKTRR
jgi:hypothetical protein